MPAPAGRAGNAVTALLRAYYAGSGLWRDCPDRSCWVHNSDWGSDTLTNTLYLRWTTAGDQTLRPIFAALAATGRTFAAPCDERRECLLWSDAPLWDSVAAAHEHDVLGSETLALNKAEAGFWAVEGSPVYARGACPSIRFQRPFGRGDHLKTLETDSNGIKAALLLYEATREPRYMTIARTRYGAVRRYFLDAHVPLYTVYVFDDSRRCVQVAHRFFASVNGNMIWNGLRLARDTGDAVYRRQALRTAHAVDRLLADPNGVYADLQAENDVVEPLFEAMLDIARLDEGGFARTWIARNAAAAYAARRADGTYGRFFDGPAAAAPVSAWQANGGAAAQIASAAGPAAAVNSPDAWRGAAVIARDIERAPATIQFRGSGIAIYGTIGERCCEFGHTHVLIDGRELTSRVGIWQNKSSSGRTFTDAILFAWRWPNAALHSVTFVPGEHNAKEGGAFLHVRAYSVIRTGKLTQ